MKNSERQLVLLKKYGVTNYTVDGENITINGYLDLRSLTSADKDFLRGTTINGSLDLRSLTSADKDFLRGTTINGGLDLRSLTSADKDFLRGNVRQLQPGYNNEGGYCYFDGVLSKVISTTTKRGFAIYTVVNGYVAQKDAFTSHAKTIKKAIQDLQFKINVDKPKNETIRIDTKITMQHYRAITGACEMGVKSWMQANGITQDAIKAHELLPLLEKTNAYGLAKFKELLEK